ncbi:MAG TPA: hypothetical protein VFS08_10585 [Gemmatimonadaceae bacterium]|nr:hypothetical protein [Gemmatimonadaceae bacterium]
MMDQSEWWSWRAVLSAALTVVGLWFLVSPWLIDREIGRRHALRQRAAMSEADREQQEKRLRADVLASVNRAYHKNGHQGRTGRIGRTR